MVVAVNIVGTEVGRLSPYGVLNTRAEQVELILGVGIAHASIEAVVVVLVAHEIEIDTDTAIGSAGLIGEVSGRIVGVGLSDTQFNDGEILIFDVQPCTYFPLPVVAKGKLCRSNEVGHHGKASEESRNRWTRSAAHPPF